MSSILVTGATGFLGRHLVELLVAEQKSPIRVLVVEPEIPNWLKELNLDVHHGSILDATTVEKAVSDISIVYHLAGFVSRNQDDARMIYSVHVDGTRVLCNAAKKAGVEKIILASSSGTIAVCETPDIYPDETWPTPMSIVARWPYYASKVYQERVAFDLCDDGPNLCVLNPSLLLGPGDDRLSSTQDIMKFLKGEIPTIPKGGINFVDVRDAARAFLNASEKGRDRERYLLGGPNWTCKEFFGRLQRISQVPGPFLQPPNRLTLFGAKIMDTVYRHIDKLPPIEYSSVEMATYYWYLDDSKARRELDFVSRDPQETLLDTVNYLRENFLGRDAFGKRTA